ncbi:MULTISPECIES: hypothetical protein [unclassified Streptomyces]|uniref:hypothetical protein n=1 Tax=unclassified Streptomyces TaxID=2593676 RepID=UPI00296666BB|nr:hypothetical protein [Streptomyces sp. SJL17-1]
MLLTLTGAIGLTTVSCLHELLSAHFSHPDLLLVGPVPRQLHHPFLRTGTLRLFTVVPDRAPRVRPTRRGRRPCRARQGLAATSGR